MALTYDQGRKHRLLVLPALFTEANALRRQTAEVMYRLDLSGIDSFLPDFPGCNESLQPLQSQTLGGWRAAARKAGEHFQATHVLTLRGGALLAPQSLPGWRYAPTTGAKILRSLLRARTIAAREAGRTETIDELAIKARTDGVELAGWMFGTDLFAALEQAIANEDSQQAIIGQDTIGGSGLWLRAEPGDSPEQADALAALITMGMLEQ